MQPAELCTLDKLRRAAGVDRRLTLREILEKNFGLIPAFSMADFKAAPKKWHDRTPR